MSYKSQEVGIFCCFFPILPILAKHSNFLRFVGHAVTQGVVAEKKISFPDTSSILLFHVIKQKDVRSRVGNEHSCFRSVRKISGFGFQISGFGFQNFLFSVRNFFQKFLDFFHFSHFFSTQKQGEKKIFGTFSF